MKMKKSLLSVVFLLATSSAMAAMSFSSASVVSGMDVSLVDTDKALLALEASSEHNAAYYANHQSTTNQLYLDLDKGNNGGDFGVQPNSVYTWDDLFKVTNNSEHEVKVNITTNPTSGGRINLSASTEGTDWTRLLGIHGSGGSLSFDLAAGASTWIDIKTDSLNGRDAFPEGFELIVDAEKVETTATLN
ncbi:hypothetical protein [Paenisporosarcina sp. TG20]|uniref:hypothetical protein n=1 Tax=Paenisporosarcina sp. TG20 TaxID=1211706 RepID=UPI0002D50884|nr:hypothetical protein [Paenisporosarcina sp. TG20]